MEEESYLQDSILRFKAICLNARQNELLIISDYYFQRIQIKLESPASNSTEWWKLEKISCIPLTFLFHLYSAPLHWRAFKPWFTCLSFIKVALKIFRFEK